MKIEIQLIGKEKKQFIQIVEKLNFYVMKKFSHVHDICF